MFEASDGRYGWLSGQLDPRLATEKQLMIQQAEELRAIRPNVIVKVPATQEGLEVLKTLTAKGISTNTTVCFTLAQMIAAARAVKEGMELAAQQGVDLTRWRSVITMVVSFAPGAGQVILDIKLAPFSAAVVGFTVAYGAYMTEVFRAGIQSIPKGQMEAARSLGMNYLQAMRYIILPQAVRVILPPIGNEFVTLLKDSSLVSVLAVSDLTRRGREFVARTFLSFDTFTLVALIYLILTLFFTRVSTGIERRLAVEKR
jgi:ABC-type amino acid transport system permease subunit